MERREVATIAQELKQGIADTNVTAGAGSVPPTPVLSPVIAQKQNVVSPPPPKKSSDGHLASGDTIYIDQEGNLHAQD
jgi:hypothetical protein